VVPSLRAPHNAPPLLHAARQAGLAFEASPNGSWIRLKGARGAVYVVQDAWGEGCLLMEMQGPQGRTMRHFLSPGGAVCEAARQVGLTTSSWLGAESGRIDSA
jgi:hypothetical protein